MTSMYQRINTAPESVLHIIKRRTWVDWGEGRISDITAQIADDAVTERRRSLRERKARVRKEKSVSERTRLRRRMAANGPCPPEVAQFYSTGELAVLCVVAYDMARFASCTRSIPEISHLSGTSEQTVRNAVNKSVKLGHLFKEERKAGKDRPTDTNILTPAIGSWMVWLIRSRVKKIRGDNQANINKREIERKKLPTQEQYSQAFMSDKNKATAMRGVTVPETEFMTPEEFEQVKTAPLPKGFLEEVEKVVGKRSILEMPDPVSNAIWKPPGAFH